MEGNECKMDISVIVCCYNPDMEKLKKTIISIIKQKNVTYEIIISDDGSKLNYRNELVEWIDSFDKVNIVYNFSPLNNGTIRNIRNALMKCKSQYCKVISPGDYFYDENALFNYVKSFKFSNADIVFGKAMYYSNDRLLKPVSPKNIFIYNNKSLKRKIILNFDYVLGASIAARTQLFYEYLGRIIDIMKFVEDIPLIFLALIENKKVISINKKLVWYEYGTGVSTTSNSKSIINKDIENFYNYLDKNLKSERIVKLAVKYFNMKNKNFIIRYGSKILNTPSFLLNSFEIFLSRFKLINDNIDKINDITKL